MRAELQTPTVILYFANLSIVQVSTAIIYCFLGAGIVFGFAALKPVLIREKVYRNLCSRAELEENIDVCDGQEIRYGSFT